MKGDFTRNTFDSRKHFNRVLMQQGRVQVDADWNEGEAIEAHLARTEAIDVIGHCGAPVHDAGFALSVSGAQLLISPGRYYVDGLLCENEQTTDFAKQPDYPNPPDWQEVLKQTGLVIAYLDVWERHVTALDDPRIREVALGGPDTTTRAKTVWQVKLLPIKPTNSDDLSLSCDDPFAEWDQLTAATLRTLNARAELPPPNSDPCEVPPTAGYRGLENQLYRVEVHQPGVVGTATFKWSRDNGTVVSLIEKISPSGKEITVSEIGKDAFLSFHPDEWVELSDDSLELNGLPGELHQIDTVNEETRTIVLKTAATLLAPALPDGVDPDLHPKLRRWDQQGGTATGNGVLVTAGFLDLEAGVQVEFDDNGDPFRTGDYWLIPARAATGDIEWPPFPPPDANPKPAPLPQPPLGITHHYCRLALLRPNDNTNGADILDCRDLFPPLTEVCAEPDTMRVVAINWENDSLIPFNLPQDGFRITLDSPPDPNSVNNNTVVFTYDIPFIQGEQTVPNVFHRLIIVGDVSVDSADPRTIVWKIIPETPGAGNIRRIFGRAAGTDAGRQDEAQGIRLGLTLKGHAIFSLPSKEGAARRYLDGQAKGIPVLDPQTQLTHIALDLPSGCCECASDFESWFFFGRGQGTQTPPRVVAARFMNVNVATGGQATIASATFPPAPDKEKPIASFHFDRRVNVIELDFDQAITADGITPDPLKQSVWFDQIAAGTPNQHLVPTLSLSADGRTVRATFKEALTLGSYRITALGKDASTPNAGGPAIRAATGNTALDGDYNGTGGDDWVALFQAFINVVGGPPVRPAEAEPHAEPRAEPRAKSTRQRRPGKKRKSGAEEEDA